MFSAYKMVVGADQFSGKFSGTPSLLILSFLSPSFLTLEHRRTVKQIPCGSPAGWDMEMFSHVSL